VITMNTINPEPNPDEESDEEELENSESIPDEELESEDSEPVPNKELELESELEINDLNDLFKAICIAKGVDPSQMQSMAKFSNFDNNDERSYYPNQFTSVAIAQLRAYGQALYRGHSWNEYQALADILSIGFMGFKGFKSEQYKDITSGQPNLDKLKGLPEETKQGILSGIFNRGGKKE
jgi:hypothetical protein